VTAEAPLRLLADLMDAIGAANTARAMVKGIAAELAACAPVDRVQLGSPALAVAERTADGWRCLDRPGRERLEQLVPGLLVAQSGAWPAFLDDPGFRAALAKAIEGGLRHVRIVDRVARSSRRAHVENRELRADLGRLAAPPAIVARSQVMRAVLARAQLVARHPTTVLLTGDSGTGKEVLAREIHRLSPRANRPLVQINCGAMPEQLVESELFGHRRGAFTGADHLHIGVFERAHRGTLFLDEVGELSPSAQVKLLRAIQERQVRRVGEVDNIDVDVRLIAATNRPLAEMVRAGQFREDLFFRLSVFAIEIPPLRERRDDLGPLVAALLRDLADRLRLPEPVVSRRAMARLAAHDWPGNVRELANVLESALVLGAGRALELPADFSRGSPRRASGTDEGSATLEAAVRKAIEAALRSTRGKIYGENGAAARLGLKPATLQSKMQKLGIRRDSFV
jgi:formate hydrogenlyase transcriptional activator